MSIIIFEHLIYSIWINSWSNPRLWEIRDIPYLSPFIIIYLIQSKVISPLPKIRDLPLSWLLTSKYKLQRSTCYGEVCVDDEIKLHIMTYILIVWYSRSCGVTISLLVWILYIDHMSLGGGHCRSVVFNWQLNFPYWYGQFYITVMDSCMIMHANPMCKFFDTWYVWIMIFNETL